MQPRTRVLLLVAVAALAAAGATLGLTALTSEPKPKAVPPPCPDGPPLELDLGVRTDREAVALRRAAARLAAGDRQAAAQEFGRFRSVRARVGAAVAAWPGATVPELRTLAAEYPREAVVRLHLGSAIFCTGGTSEARSNWTAAKRLAPDSPVAVRAGDLLNPQYPIPGIPIFVPGFSSPSELDRLSPRRRFVELRRRSRAEDVRAKLLYGVALQQLGRQRSAEAQYGAAARLAPDDAEAQVAAAVGRFDKERPSAAFSRLGPLTRRFPRAVTARFHLGLLLLWLGDVDGGRAQLERARRLAPSSPLGREAARFLARLDERRTN